MAGGSNATKSIKGSVSLAEQQRAAASPPFVCVECGRPVARLFREYNKGNIRLGRCGFCRSVADKYIECEFVLIAIDLALHRIQAYRHVLFNRKPFSTHNFHGRLWQLGIAMAALDAHLRHTALSSEAAQDPARNLRMSNTLSAEGGGGSDGSSGGDPFWEAGGLLLAAVVEHACFAAGAVLWARRSAAMRHRNRRRGGGGGGKINRSQKEEDDDDGGSSSNGDGGGNDDRRQGGGDNPSLFVSPLDNVEAFSPALALPMPPQQQPPTSPTPAATKIYMAVVYPLFFRLLAAFVMIWDRQVATLNTIELLVATMQFVALSAVIGGPAAGTGMGEGGVAAAAIIAGLASKMGARGVLCVCFGSDSRTLRML